MLISDLRPLNVRCQKKVTFDFLKNYYNLDFLSRNHLQNADIQLVNFLIFFIQKMKQDYFKALIEGEEKGLRKLYEAFLPRIGHFITTHGGTKEDARDIFQDALMIIYQKANEGKLELTSNFYTLLYGICRKLWRNE